MAIMRDGAVVQIGRPIDLILNPADDYVREFTQDVPWERILRAEDILEDGAPQSGDLGRTAQGTLVETLLPALAQNDGGVLVEAADGTPLGVATARGLAAALAAGCAVEPTAGEG